MSPKAAETAQLGFPGAPKRPRPQRPSRRKHPEERGSQKAPRFYQAVLKHVLQRSNQLVNPTPGETTLIALLLRVPARCFRQDYTRRRTQFRPEVSLPVSVSLSVCGGSVPANIYYYHPARRKSEPQGLSGRGDLVCECCATCEVVSKILLFRK